MKCQWHGKAPQRLETLVEVKQHQQRPTSTRKTSSGFSQKQDARVLLDLKLGLKSFPPQYQLTLSYLQSYYYFSYVTATGEIPSLYIENMILTLRVCDVALVQFYKKNFNYDFPY